MVESNTSQILKPIQPPAQLPLKEVEDAFPNNLPLGFSLLIGTEYQIDLLWDASLPNKQAYRCIPSESRELQRQV